MPHVTETTLAAAWELGLITDGARLVRRFWGEHKAPHAYLGSFFTAHEVTSDAEGRAALVQHSYRENRRTPGKVTIHYAPDDVVSVVAMTATANGARTYLHHDDRLILPGGYMDAHPGTMHGVWDVFHHDGTPIAQRVNVERGRALLAKHAPEMVWAHLGDGVWETRGHGRYWRVARDGRNPDFDAHAPLTRAWLYALSYRPLDGGEWVKVAQGCETPEDAKSAAPAA